ncbi:MAG: adenylyl-sulfate kinase [Candidatus Caenarcaniphilales bacterium]|nr:adenylyl-sulfate kinase [Candidatus Caenarcaniphilales bacterium]
MNSKDINENLVEFNYSINERDREKKNGCKGSAVWFTGPSASGKSTIANELEILLFNKGYPVVILDGDNVRKGLCSDLDFSLNSRTENVRRVAEVAKIIKNSGFIVLCCLVSPLIEQRKLARSIIEKNFIECYVKTPLDKCMERDPKGFYKKARNNQILDFTGVNSIYEESLNSEIVVQTELVDERKAAAKIYKLMKEKFLIF